MKGEGNLLKLLHYERSKTSIDRTDLQHRKILLSNTHYCVVSLSVGGKTLHADTDFGRYMIDTAS